jgi:enoyl-CoA hydratase/carnithine racemase
MTDIIIASDTASFGQPEINLGFIPGAGGTFRWPKLVGKYIASEIIMTGRNINAQEAKELGLVNKVVSKEKLMDEALTIAQTIASKSPLAIKFAKKLINRALDFPTEVCLELERRYFDLLFDTEETKKLIDKFLNK